MTIDHDEILLIDVKESKCRVHSKNSDLGLHNNDLDLHNHNPDIDLHCNNTEFALHSNNLDLHSNNLYSNDLDLHSNDQIFQVKHEPVFYCDVQERDTHVHKVSNKVVESKTITGSLSLDCSVRVQGKSGDLIAHRAITFQNLLPFPNK